MKLNDLVGHLAIRSCHTQYGKTDFINQPVFILSCADGTALGCLLDDTDRYTAGMTVVISGDYLDNNWLDFGGLLTQASQTRAQGIVQILHLLGIDADMESVTLLCKATAFKQIFSEIEEQLELSDIINAMQKPKTAERQQGLGVDTLSSASTWDSLTPRNAPQTGTVVNNSARPPRTTLQGGVGNFVRRNTR